MSLERLEILDLIILVLQDHERELSRLAYRLERIAERLERGCRRRRGRRPRRRRT